MLGLGALLAIYIVGYRRRGFPPIMQTLIVVLVLLLAFPVGSQIVGAAYTAVWLLSLYRGTRIAALTAGLAVSIVIGESTAAHGLANIDPGNLLGETASMAVVAAILSQLRVSLAERAELHKILSRQARHDFVTDLPNRHSFQERLDGAVERYRAHGEPYAVLMIDVDDFKRINDTHGHEQGDAVLLAVAQRAAACMRESDLCARLGGDEFAVLVTECHNPQIATDLAKRLEREIRRDVVLDGVIENISVSVGLAWSGDSAEVALREADRAMYVAKSGKARRALAGSEA